MKGEMIDFICQILFCYIFCLDKLDKLDSELEISSTMRLNRVFFFI